MKIRLFFAILILLNITNAFAKIYTIAYPSNDYCPIYSKTINELKNLGYTDGKNIKFKKIDFNELKNSTFRKKFEEETDIILTFFDNLPKIKKLKINKPIIFFGPKELSEIYLSKNKKNITGIWCESLKNILKEANEMIENKNFTKIGFPYEKGSSLEKLSASYITFASKFGIELLGKPYETTKDIKNIMNFYKENTKAVFIFQSPKNIRSLNAFIDLQNKLNLPVLGKIKKDIKRGMFGGVVIDIENISKKLAEYISKILKGRTPEQLPISTFQSHPVINLFVVSKLNIKIPRNIIKKSIILGFKHKNTNSSKIKDVKVKPGKYTLAISENNIQIINKKIIEALKNKGYIEKQNLNIIKFDLNKNELTPIEIVNFREKLSKVDVFFITDNVVYNLIKLNLQKPVVLLGVSDVNSIPKKYEKFFTGVWRTSCKRIINMAKRIFPKSKNIAMIYNNKIKISHIINQHMKVAEQMNINLVVKTFTENNNIINIMKQLKNKVDIVILFPAGITDEHIKTFVKMQNELKLPVLSHLKHHIEMGIVAGPTVDLENIIPKLTEYIDKLFQGRKPEQLKKYEFIPKYVINLKSAYHLDLKIPRSIIRQSEIIK